MNDHRKKLIAVETHPIQYKVPLFRSLAKHPALDFKVLYAMLPDETQQGAGFGVSFSWDLPLLEGYPCQVLDNVAQKPGVTHFSGCDTPDIYDFLKRERPDAVLVNGWVVKTCLQALWACRRLGIPCLVRGEANLLRPRAAWKHLMHRLLLHQYAGCLYIGAANKAFYAFHGIPESRLFFAPYAVDNQYFSEKANGDARRTIRARHGIPDDAVTFLFTGKLETKKHPLDLMKAVLRLPPELSTRLHVLYVGDGELRAELERYGRDYRLPCTLTGFINQGELPAYYAAADVLVLPSDAGETWGLVVNEAMASGLPAIVSDRVGCCKDLISDQHGGRSFPFGNVDHLAECLASYVRDPVRAVREGLEARRIIAGYGLEQVVVGVVSAVEVTTSKA